MTTLEVGMIVEEMIVRGIGIEIEEAIVGEMIEGVMSIGGETIEVGDIEGGMIEVVMIGEMREEVGIEIEAIIEKRIGGEMTVRKIMMEGIEKEFRNRRLLLLFFAHYFSMGSQKVR